METNIQISQSQEIKINMLTMQKMTFFYNALEDGWEIKKQGNKYIFTKKHEGKKEVFSEDYLKRFIKMNFDINKIVNDE
jgi:hypothetical protein